MKNLFMFGEKNKTLEIAKKIWEKNNEFGIVGIEKEFKKYKVPYEHCITIIEPKRVKNIKINTVIEMIEKNNGVPVIISNGNDFARLLMTNLEDIFQDSIMYVLNEENIDFDEFINYCSQFVLKGKENDNIVSPPTGRKG